MSAETFRAVMTGIIVCALGGLTIPGIFAVFALQSRVSRRDDYLRLMCDALDWLRTDLRDLSGTDDPKVQAYIESILVIAHEANLGEFFEPEYSSLMETQIRHMADRYSVLRRATGRIAQHLKDCTDLNFGEREKAQADHMAAMAYVIDASDKTERFERGMTKIKRQIWPSWFVGIGVLVASLIALCAADICKTFAGALVLHWILLLLLIGVASELVAATLAVCAILREADR